MRRIGLLVAGSLVAALCAVETGRAQDAARSPQLQRADALVSKADSLREARQIGPADARYREALALYRRGGDRAHAAEARNEIGILHALQDEYDQALDQLRKATSILREVEHDEELAKTLNNQAIVHRWAGEYEQAIGHYEEVLQLYETVGTEAERATVLYNLGLVYEDLGEYDTALENYENALDVYRKLEDQAGVARSHDVIGDILYQWGQYEEALGHFQRALSSFRNLDQDDRIANALNGIGNVYQARGDYPRALQQYREALRINRELDDRSRVAYSLNNIGAVYLQQGRVEDALEMVQKALQINREIGRRPSVAVNLNEIGRVYRHRGDYAEAIRFFEKALNLNRLLERAAGIATSLEELGLARMMAGQYEAADSTLRASIRITEDLLATASGEDQRDFLAKEIHRFQALVATQGRAGRPHSALRTLERSRTRLLTQRLAEGRMVMDSTERVPTVDSLQRTIARNEAAVLYANTDTQRPVTVFVVTHDSVRMREVPAASVLDRVGTQYQEALTRLRIQEEIPWGSPSQSLLRQAKGIEFGTESEGRLANLIRLYRHDLSVPPSQQLLSEKRRDRLGQFLYSVLIDPIEEDIASKETLTVVPDGALSYLPFEVLSDWGGTRVIDQWRVRYIQSLRVLGLLQNRRSTRAARIRRPLLALGGVEYDRRSYSTDPAGPETADSILATVGSSRSETGRLVSDLYSETSSDSIRSGAERSSGPTSSFREFGYGPDRWDNLPGTAHEVQALGRIAGSSTLLVGSTASEDMIHQLSHEGVLSEYRAIHFATHGFVVPEQPALSALVLSDSGIEQDEQGTVRMRPRLGGDLVADGYLTMDEIAQLDLNAEFVGLSACRTGLGRIYRGSGAVSFVQAFFRAGAGSVAVSLWSVFDASTSRFMEAVYERAWNRDVSWSEAMAQTKRAFANGHHGDRLQSPRFWAPFVFYGGDASPAAD